MDNTKDHLQVIDNVLFFKIFKTFNMAIQPSKIIIAFLAIAAIFFVGWIMDRSHTVIVTGDGQTELDVYLSNPSQLQQFLVQNCAANRHTGVFGVICHLAKEEFHQAISSLFALDPFGIVHSIVKCLKGARWAITYHLIYCAILSVVQLSVAAIAGGAICRIAALQLAQGEKPGLIEALRYSTSKFTNFFAAPLAPIGISICLGLLIALLGLLGNIPIVGELIIGISVPVALFIGILIAVVLVGTAAGFNLMFPAVAYDGSDCFDAISRSFSYIYARPWRMAFYTSTAAIYGSVCYTFVRFFVFLILWAAHSCLRPAVWTEAANGVNKLSALWPEPTFANMITPVNLSDLNWSGLTGVFLVQIFLTIMGGLIIAFLVSFYFSANTIIYATLRNKVDNTPIEDIYTCLGNTKTKPNATNKNLEPKK